MKIPKRSNFASHSTQIEMLQKGRKYGLIGYPLVHSFSKKFFSEKFEKEGLTQYSYELFPLEDIGCLPDLLTSNPSLCGLNVTIPYKQAVLPFLNDINEEVQAIGAVNVIQMIKGKLIGYNSDVYGFEVSLKAFLEKSQYHTAKIKALILGTGGASLAVRYVLEKMDIQYVYVSRSEQDRNLTYEEITPGIMEQHHLVINCTPLGTYPNIDSCPNLPYNAITEHHYFYDLVYNPTESLFLKKAKANGAATLNGLAMLHLQAERSWEIWNKIP